MFFISDVTTPRQTNTGMTSHECKLLLSWFCMDSFMDSFIFLISCFVFPACADQEGGGFWIRACLVILIGNGEGKIHCYLFMFICSSY